MASVCYTGAVQNNMKCKADFHSCQFLSAGRIIWLDSAAQMEDSVQLVNLEMYSFIEF